MKTEEMIKELEKQGYKIEEPKSRFAEVKLSKEKGILLENKNSGILIDCICDEISLNDFEYFDAYDTGQFWINGHIQPVELKLNGKWIRFDEQIHGRFLR